jgi:hypothetical protein
VQRIRGKHSNEKNKQGNPLRQGKIELHGCTFLSVFCLSFSFLPSSMTVLKKLYRPPPAPRKAPRIINQGAVFKT